MFLLSLTSFLFSSFVSIDHDSHDHMYDSARAYHEAKKSKKTPRRRLRTVLEKPFPEVRLELPWEGHFSAKHFRENSTDQIKLKGIKKNLEKSLLALPKKHTQHLQKLEVIKKPHASRGMANGKRMLLHTESIDDEDELISVFIHEMGHVVDLGSLGGINGGESEFYDGKKPIFESDTSLKFYRISWADALTLKEGVMRKDFISGYAMASPFEDFAESFLFYRMHGDKFRHIAKKSDLLHQKYLFMKRYVFSGEEFQTEKSEKPFLHHTMWDATLLDIDQRDLIVK